MHKTEFRELISSFLFIYRSMLQILAALEEATRKSGCKKNETAEKATKSQN